MRPIQTNEKEKFIFWFKNTYDCQIAIFVGRIEMEGGVVLFLIVELPHLIL